MGKYHDLLNDESVEIFNSLKKNADDIIIYIDRLSDISDLKYDVFGIEDDYSICFKFSAL